MRAATGGAAILNSYTAKTFIVQRKPDLMASKNAAKAAWAKVKRLFGTVPLDHRRARDGNAGSTGRVGPELGYATATHSRCWTADDSRTIQSGNLCKMWSTKLSAKRRRAASTPLRAQCARRWLMGTARGERGERVSAHIGSGVWGPGGGILLRVPGPNLLSFLLT